MHWSCLDHQLQMFIKSHSLSECAGEDGSNHSERGGSARRSCNGGRGIQVLQEHSWSVGRVSGRDSHELGSGGRRCKLRIGSVQVQLHGRQPQIFGLVGTKAQEMSSRSPSRAATNNNTRIGNNILYHSSMIAVCSFCQVPYCTWGCDCRRRNRSRHIVSHAARGPRPLNCW